MRRTDDDFLACTGSKWSLHALWHYLKEERGCSSQQVHKDTKPEATYESPSVTEKALFRTNFFHTLRVTVDMRGSNTNTEQQFPIQQRLHQAASVPWFLSPKIVEFRLQTLIPECRFAGIRSVGPDPGCRHENIYFSGGPHQHPDGRQQASQVAAHQKYEPSKLILQPYASSIGHYYCFEIW